MDSTFAGSIGIVGAGRLGTALALALTACGYRVGNVAGRSEAPVARLAHRIGAIPAPLDALIATSELVFLAVPDAAIEAVAAAGPWRPDQGVVHCSGALGLDVLARADARGAVPGCFHPLQSFSGDDQPEQFHGIAVGIEGSAPVVDWLLAIAGHLQARAFRLEGVDRALYHAAAVVASNDVVALMVAAGRAWEAAGLPVEAARTALAPLLLGAARNIAARPLAEALTGPVARGDVATVHRHLEALRAQPDLAALYRALGRELLTLPLALEAGARAQLEALFGGTRPA